MIPINQFPIYTFPSTIVIGSIQMELLSPSTLPTIIVPDIMA
jgi:hypothetical protein